MSPSFVVYIDESGDDGLRIKPGVSEWLVLSAVVTRVVNDVETVKLVDRFRQQYGLHPKKPIHFRKLDHPKRIALIDAIALADLRAISVLIHKPTLSSPELFEERNRLYFYGARLLFERVSWCCRDFRVSSDTGDGSAQIVFSKRSDLSYGEIQRCMSVLKKNSGGIARDLDWGVIRPDQIEAHSHGRRMGLQIADAVASGHHFAVRNPADGRWCAEYACGLKPVIYHNHGKYLGYGLKIFPKEAGSVTCKPHCGWIHRHYA